VTPKENQNKNLHESQESLEKNSWAGKYSGFG
jgi:hypothetical protein